MSLVRQMPLGFDAKNIVRWHIPRGIRNWLRSPSASARWVWDEAKFQLGMKKIVQMRPDWKLICHPAAYRCAYSLQQYDAEQVAEFDGFIKHSAQGMILFDVGAHFGLFSLASLHYGGQRARAIAFDPSPTAVRLLAVQAKLCHVDSRLQIIQAALGDQPGWQDMVAVGVLASGFYVAPSKECPTGDITKTPVVTLDSIVEELKVFPTHIKIDVEGGEAAVLRGGRKTLSLTSAPILFVEIHNEIVKTLGGNPEDTLFLLRHYGYETFTVEDVPIDDDQILSEPLIRIIARRARELSNPG